jgi:hypothetical protein
VVKFWIYLKGRTKRIWRVTKKMIRLLASTPERMELPLLRKGKCWEKLV